MTPTQIAIETGYQHDKTNNDNTRTITTTSNPESQHPHHRYSTECSGKTGTHQRHIPKQVQLRTDLNTYHEPAHHNRGTPRVSHNIVVPPPTHTAVSPNLSDVGLRWPPPNILQLIQVALTTPPRIMGRSSFRFELTAEAAQHNWEIIRRDNYRWDDTIRRDSPSPCDAGSEFRTMEALDPIFRHHPRWPLARQHLTLGVIWPADDVPEPQRLQDLKEALEYGNHRSAELRGSTTLEHLSQEVAHGWQLPIPIDALNQIPGIYVSPLGLAEQHSVDEQGQRIRKDRLTHDLSFSFGGSQQSVNSRVRQEELSSHVYGCAFSRFIHLVISNPPTAASITTSPPLDSVSLQPKNLGGATEEALIGIRMSFGGCPGPSQWNDLAEPMADTVNVLLQLKEWRETMTPRSRYRDVLDTVRTLDPSIPFHQARPLAVDLQISAEAGGGDVFIDDFFTAYPSDDPNLGDRGAEAALLVTDTVGRPLQYPEPLPREELLSKSKTRGEGTPTERLIILGWLVDTRTLTISLPEDKYKYRAWIADINAFLQTPPARKTAHKPLQSLIGRLQHVANIIPMAQHFMSRLRTAETRADKYSGTHLSKYERDDLKLWCEILSTANQGISMNLLVAQVPTSIWRCDASILEAEVQCEDCLIVVSDNTAAAGWLQKSNFPPTTEKDLHLDLARDLARTAITAGISLKSRWRRGIDNTIADILSRPERLPNLTPSGDCFVRPLLLGAADAAKAGVTAGTHAKANAAWKRWEDFLHHCELDNDPFLETFSRHHRHQLLGAFLHHVRTTRKATTRSRTGPGEPLMAATCTNTLEAVSKAFNTAGFPDPRLDESGKTAHVLRRQLRGYNNLDPATRHQKCIPFSLICDMVQRPSDTPILVAFHQLFLLGFFFAMRSCENFKPSGEERRTNPIRLRNLIFRKHHQNVPHTSPLLEQSDSITVVFEFQKRDLKNDGVTQLSTGHPWQCPVKAAAAIVRRLQRMHATNDTFCYTYTTETGKTALLQSSQALRLLRDYIRSIDHKRYGLSPNDIGLHSLRSSAAMAMVLNQVPAYIILMLGRWSSDAVLRYIRKQVEEFGQDVSKRMILNPKYHHVDDTDTHDPRTHNPLSSVANMGMGSGHSINHGPFSVW